MSRFKNDITFDKICAKIAKDYIESDMFIDFCAEQYEDTTGDWLEGKDRNELLDRVKFQINQYTERPNT